MATVTDATVRVALWENIYDALTGLTYSSSTEPGVYRNNSDIDQDDSFPRVVIHPLTIDITKESFGTGYYGREITVLIDVWAKKNKDLDIIADKIQNDFETRSYTGAHFTSINEATTINTDVNQKLYLTTFTVSFMRG
jgi:hypothetical protein